MKQETGRRIPRWGYMAVAAGYLWWNLARMTEFYGRSPLCRIWAT